MGSAYSALQEAGYVAGDVLGQGSFGKVLKCTKREGNGDDVFAVKVVDFRSSKEEIENEIKMQKMLEHDTVLRLHRAIWEQDSVFLVMDLYEGDNVTTGIEAYWQQHGLIPPHRSLHISRQMLQAIAWLHSNNVVHRDVKGDNFLMDRPNIVDPDCRVVLSDFGTAAQVEPDEKLKKRCGTRLYWAPELYKRQHYGLKVDIWALGVIQYAILAHRFAFQDKFEVLTKSVKFEADIPEECQEFCQIMLDKNEETRPQAEELLAHPWLQGMPASNEDDVKLEEVPTEGTATDSTVGPSEMQDNESEVEDDAAKTTSAANEEITKCLTSTGRFEPLSRVSSKPEFNDVFQDLDIHTCRALAFMPFAGAPAGAPFTFSSPAARGIQIWQW